MFLLKNRISILFLSGFFFSCGETNINDRSPSTNNEPEKPKVLHLAVTPDQLFCPNNFHYNEATMLCESVAEAMGPFPTAMVTRCQQLGGGSACEKSFWQVDFARKIRGDGICPLGATREDHGLCVEGDNIYGPFTHSHVENCRQAGGGSACESLRWAKGFALATLPEPVADELFTFPFTGPATASYREPPRSFGSCRSRCRRYHAAADLYGHIGRPVYAVGAGKVIDFHYFYDGTYALIVDHRDFIVRYGEVSGNLPAGTKVGADVKRGQLIAYVGDLVSLDFQMVHFERFTGAASGSLTNNSNPPFYRRWDLVDPTEDLLAWKYPK